MANTDIKTSELPQTSSMANTDLFVVVRSPNSSPTTNTATLSTVMLGIGSSLSGPYSNDASAAAANVALKSLYYDTSGLIHIRLV
jgi:hypothetical protein